MGSTQPWTISSRLRRDDIRTFRAVIASTRIPINQEVASSIGRRARLTQEIFLGYRLHHEAPISDCTMKRPFLTVYDYGQGGVWLFLLAESEQQIRERYPDLQIAEKPPQSLDEEQLADIRAGRTLDIDDESDPFLASLRKRRESR